MKLGKGKAIRCLLAVSLLVGLLPTTALAKQQLAANDQGYRYQYPAVSQVTGQEAAQINNEDLLIDPNSIGEASQPGNINESEVNINKAKAIELAKKYVQIPDQYKIQSTSLNKNFSDENIPTTWNLSFEHKQNTDVVGRIYVGIHAMTGQLVAYQSSTYHQSPTTSYPLKTNREAAQKIAEGFIKEVEAGYASQVKIDPNFGVALLPSLTGDVVHRFEFVRQVNDIPFIDNYIRIGVNSEGYVTEYNMSWDEKLEFPKLDSIISMEQAKSQLQKVAGPQLKYIQPYQAREINKPYLAYIQPEVAIDAITGNKMIEPNYNIYYYGGEPEAEPITKQPLGSKPEQRELTEAQIIDMIKSSFNLHEAAQLTYSGNHEEMNEQGEFTLIWNISWSIKKDGKEIGHVWANVDGNTGQIKQFSQYLFDQKISENAELISLDQASSKAIEAVKKHLPWLTHELYLIKPNSEQFKSATNNSSNYYFRFAHKVHGAIIDNDSVGVSIDLQTGDIVNFEAYIQPYQYASSLPKIISEQEAVASWLDYYDIMLTYHNTTEYSLNGKPLPIEKYNTLLAAGMLSEAEEISAARKMNVVYKLRAKPTVEEVFLDAQTGEWRNYRTGEVTQLQRQQATDIDGHWAKEQLELMIAYQAIDLVDGKVRPNEAIKRGELIKMLVIARSGGTYNHYNKVKREAASFADVASTSSYFSYVEDALSQNLIDIGNGSFNPEGIVTRDEMAELIVRALGYNPLAKVEGIFQDSFTDSKDIRNKGQAAIVVGLNIMSTNKQGNFQPKKQVTRAEAATAFFRYLQASAQLNEAPLRAQY